jgi:transcriptional regulator with XRE-family HTH domain
MNNGARSPSVVIDVVGTRVREARQAAGLTQQELAAQANLSRITVSRIERGQRKQLKPAALKSIALATQKPEAYFYAVKSPNESLEEAIERSNMSHRLAVLLPRVTELPLVQQERLGGIIEELLDWHDNGKAS